jgi:ubiquinone/menaquinone biosynthesis C-methylase UbiE
MGIRELAGETGATLGPGFWPRFYDAAAEAFGDDPFSFFNLGFVDPERSDPGLDLADAELAERLSEQLYERILADVDLAGRVVLEVGCGRGGGCVHIARTHRPAELIGVDRSGPLINHCREVHRDAGLRFEQGEAEALPVDSESVEVVVNVESSHCYPSRLSFFQEVARVLKPGGSLAIGDILLPDGDDEPVKALEATLTRAGLEILGSEEMTAGVVAARDLASESALYRARLEAAAPGAAAIELLEKILCLRGTPFYDALRRGRVVYWRWTARKPGGAASAAS